MPKTIIDTTYALDRETILQRLIFLWRVPERPHCSNCVKAKVHGDPAEPMCYCHAGHGKEQELRRMIRGKAPRGFRDAASCEAWEQAGPMAKRKEKSADAVC